GKRNCYGSGALSELFENPIHPLQIHMVPPFVDENSPTFHLQIHGEEVYGCREICGKPATVFDLLQVSVKPLGYQFKEPARDPTADGSKTLQSATSVLASELNFTLLAGSLFTT
ncbi:unnamed protein product, partial [Porites evermanni]